MVYEWQWVGPVSAGVAQSLLGVLASSCLKGSATGLSSPRRPLEVAPISLSPRKNIEV